MPRNDRQIGAEATSTHTLTHRLTHSTVHKVASAKYPQAYSQRSGIEIRPAAGRCRQHTHKLPCTRATAGERPAGECPLGAAAAKYLDEFATVSLTSRTARKRSGGCCLSRLPSKPGLAKHLVRRDSVE